MLNSVFSNITTDLGIGSILFCSLSSVILGIIIALVHKYTSKYSKNFLITLAVLPILVEIVIIMVNGNLGTSVAIVGAFSLVRFRSIPGTSKEILSVFFAMAIGLILGMGYIIFAIIMTILVSVFMVVLSKVKLLDKNVYEKILRITIPEDLDYTSVFDDLFNKYLNSYSLDSVKTTNMGSLFELSYKINMKKDINEKKFIDDLRVRNGNLKIMLTHELGDGDL